MVFRNFLEIMNIHGVKCGREFGYNEVGKRRMYLAGKW